MVIFKKELSKDNRYSLKLILEEQALSDQNQQKNNSYVNYKLSLIKASGTGYWTYNENNPIKLEINETTIIDKNISYDFRGSTPKEIIIAEGTLTIDHDDDGSKTINYYAYFNDVDNNRGYAEISEELKLVDIPRASSVGVTDSDIGATATVIINKTSSKFKHTLRWECGSLNGIIVSKTSNQTVAWAVPTDLYKLIPNSLSTTVTVYCDTYSGDTLIGTKQTTFKANVNQDDNKPDVSATLEDINPVTFRITNDSTKLIKFFSNVKTIISATAKNSATIKSYKVVCGDGKTATTQTSTINGVESGIFNIYVTDSRGLTTKLEKTLTMDPYVKLTLNTEVGRVSSTGSTAKVSVWGNFYVGPSSEKGTWATLSLMYRYREKGSSTWSGYTEIADNIHYGVSSSNWNNYYLYDFEIEGDFSYTKQYEFEFIACDELMTLTSKQTLKVGQPNHWWNKSSFNHNTDIFFKSGNQILDYEVVDTW